MRFKASAARAVTARASPKTEHDDQLRVAKEILQALRNVGWNAELADDATAFVAKRLN